MILMDDDTQIIRAISLALAVMWTAQPNDRYHSTAQVNAVAASFEAYITDGQVS